jgi:hypothetical protein
MSYLTNLLYVFTTIVGITLGYLFRVTECLHRGYFDTMIVGLLVAILGLFYTALTSLFYFMIMFIIGWVLSDSTWLPENYM